jgi:GNAT superfamily N-acetyltransferase
VAPKARALRIVPATSERWNDVVELFGERGACAGCWCMWWRRSRADWVRGKGLGNRRALRALVMQGPAPGLLAYLDGRPVGWIALAPRDQYPRLLRARTLVGPDARPVWSITCLFVERGHRRQGLSVALIEAAAAHARACGATLIEGYPVEPTGGHLPDAFAFTGLRAAYARAGFNEVARSAPTRSVVRKSLAREAP